MASFAGKFEWACESFFFGAMARSLTLSLSFSLSLSLSLSLSALIELLQLSQFGWASQLTVLIRLNLSLDLAVILSYFSCNGCFEASHGIRLDWLTSKLLYAVLIAFTFINLVNAQIFGFFFKQFLNSMFSRWFSRSHRTFWGLLQVSVFWFDL